MPRLRSRAAVAFFFRVLLRCKVTSASGSVGLSGRQLMEVTAVLRCPMLVSIFELVDVVERRLGAPFIALAASPRTGRMARRDRRDRRDQASALLGRQHFIELPHRIAHRS